MIGFVAGHRFLALVFAVAVALVMSPAGADASHRCRSCNQYCSSPECVYCDACCWAQLQDWKQKLFQWKAHAECLAEKVQRCKEETCRLETLVHEIAADRDKYKLEAELCCVRLKAAEHELHETKHKLHEAREELEHALRKVGSLEEKLKECREELHECRDELKETKHALHVATHERDAARKEADELRLAVATTRALAETLKTQLDDCRQHGAGLETEIGKLQEQLRSAQADLSKSGVWVLVLGVALIVAVLILFFILLYAHLRAGYLQLTAAVAHERAEGAIREMAANKKDCCCKCGPSVVYGPVTTPNGPVTSPNGPVTTSTTTTPNGAVTTESSDPTVLTTPNGATTTCTPNGPGHSTTAPTPVSNTAPTPTTTVPTTTQQETVTPNGPSHVTAPTPSSLAAPAPAPNSTAAPDAGAAGTAAAGSEAKGGDAQAFAF